MPGSYSSGYSAGYGAPTQQVKYWIGGTAGNSSDNSRWSLSSGGANDTTAPFTGDTVIYDANGLGDCSWNSTVTVAAFTETAGYTGTVTIAAGVTQGITGDQSIGDGCGFIAVSTAQVNLDGDIAWNASANIDFQNGSIFNTGGNLVIPNGNSYIMNCVLTIAKDGGSVDVANADNSSRIETVILTADSIINQTNTFYGDHITGPATGTVTWTGAGTIVTQNPYTNKQNIVCSATTNGGIELSDGTASTTIGNYGNWCLNGGNKTISGSGTMSAYCYNAFQLSQNTTIIILCTGDWNLVVTDEIKIGDTIVQNRGGRLQWHSSGNITCDKLNVNESDGVQTKSLELNATSGNISVLRDYLQDINTSLVATLATNTITVGENINIDFNSSCDFGSTTVIHSGTGTILNQLSGNGFNILSGAFTGEKTTFGEIGYINRLIVNGGTVTAIASTEWITLGRSVDDVKILEEAGATPTTFDNSGGGWVSFYLYTLGVSINTLDGFNIGNGIFQFRSINGTISMLGDVTAQDIHAVTGAGRFNGNTITLSDLLNIDGGALDIGTGATITADKLEYNSPGDVLTGSGTITCSEDVTHIQATLNIADITLTARDYIPSAGVTLNADTTINLTGDYNPANETLWTANWGTNGRLNMIGTTTQTIQFGGQGEPVFLCNANHTASVQLLDGPLNGATKFCSDATTGNTDTQFPTGIQVALIDINSIGSGSNTNLMDSDTDTVQANISMVNNGTAFHADFKDINLTGAVLFADSVTCNDLGNNNLSPDGVQEGIYFTPIQYPVDNIYKTNRVTKKTIQRRGTVVPAITLSELYTGDDWGLEFTFTDNGEVIDLSGVTSIYASVVSSGNVALIPQTAQSSTTAGANWAEGKVVIVFTAALTTDIIPARNAWVEVQVKESGGNVFTFPREQVRIIKGVIS